MISYNICWMNYLKLKYNTSHRKSDARENQAKIISTMYLLVSMLYYIR